MRNRLATLALQGGQPDAALAVLSGSTNVEDLQVLPTSLELEAVAQSLTRKPALRDVQRAIMLAPWAERHWQALAFVRAGDHE